MDIHSPDPIKAWPDPRWPDFDIATVSHEEKLRRMAGGTPLFRQMYDALDEILAEWDKHGWNDTCGIAWARSTMALFKVAFPDG